MTSCCMYFEEWLGVVFPIRLFSVRWLMKASEVVTVEQSSEGSEWEPSDYSGTGILEETAKVRANRTVAKEWVEGCFQYCVTKNRWRGKCKNKQKKNRLRLTGV